MRDIEKNQEVITAIQEGTLNNLSLLLNKPEISKYKRGKVDNPEFIRDVILYTYCLRAADLKEENFILCMQNMQNCVQQYLLDKVYNNRELEEAVFTKCSHLFKEKIAIDFVRDFGIPKVRIDSEVFLERVISRLIEAVEIVNLPSNEVKELAKTLDNVKLDYINDLDKTIEVSINERESKTPYQVKNVQDGIMVQVQEKQAIQVQEQIKIQEWVTDSIETSNFPARSFKLSAEELFSNSFGNASSLSSDNGGQRLKNSANYELFELNNVLKTKFPKMWHLNLFSQNILVTRNFVTTLQNQINIHDNFQKPISQLLVLEDVSGTHKTFKVVILSSFDAEQIAQHFETGNNKLPKDRRMWLLRIQGDLSWPGPSPYDKKRALEEDNLKKLLLQVNFFAGNLFQLEQSRWNKALGEWLNTIEDRQFVISFFENSVLRDRPKEEYLFTNTRKLLHKLV